MGILQVHGQDPAGEGDALDGDRVVRSAFDVGVRYMAGAGDGLGLAGQFKDSRLVVVEASQVQAIEHCIRFEMNGMLSRITGSGITASSVCVPSLPRFCGSLPRG